MVEMDKQMAKEIQDGRVADPMEVQQLSMGVHPEQMPGGQLDPNMGQMPQDPEIDGSATEAQEMPKGGEI